MTVLTFTSSVAYKFDVVVDKCVQKWVSIVAIAREHHHCFVYFKLGSALICANIKKIIFILAQIKADDHAHQANPEDAKHHIVQQHPRNV